MTITKQENGTELIIAIKGRLDTATAPQLESELKASIGNTTVLILDLSEIEYISSAGLRVLLFAQRTMNKQGVMKVTHVNETVLEVFEITGFCDILNIE